MSPAHPAEEDFFLHVLEIGKLGATGKPVELIDGVNFKGAASESGVVGLFATSDSAIHGGELTLAKFRYKALFMSGLQPNTVYELSFVGPNVSSPPADVLPGVLAEVIRLRSNNHGILRLEGPRSGNMRLRIARI